MLFSAHIKIYLIAGGYGMSKITFDKDFLFGVAGASFQFLGCGNSPQVNWCFKSQTPGVADGLSSGKACDFWKYLPDDIKRMKDLGVKAFRFSFEWADVEPEQGKIDAAAIERYHKFFAELAQAQIEPWMTLHHFTQPKWFEDRGGFECEDNVIYFIDFCKLMVREFGDKVTWWGTFNEPGIYVMQSYINGKWVPGKNCLKSAGFVLKNMLQTHVRLYKELKEINPAIKIGFMHNIMPFHPYTKWNLFERIYCYYANHVLHDSITNFFKNGLFSFKVPFKVSIQANNIDAPLSYDFFGMNYYTSFMMRMRLSFKKMFSMECHTLVEKNDERYCVHSEGLYHAIKKIHKEITGPRNIPIYITENGIADTQDYYRATFIEHTLKALHRAVEEKCDVRGYFYWSLLDNFEWDEGYAKRFGLYEVDFETQERKLRKGAQVFKDIVHNTYKKGR